MKILPSRAFFLLILLFWLLDSRAQAAGSSLIRAHSLDALLQDYAYKAFQNPKTGIPFIAKAPSNFSGIEIGAMRLRSGSLRRKGVRYNEFHIPMGVREVPYVKRLILVYHNLKNWSMHFYPPPSGYMYLTPILGLLAYDASNLSAINLKELTMEILGDGIMIEFQNVTKLQTSFSKCICIDLNGDFNWSNVSSNGTCWTVKQGHFSIVSPLPAVKRKKKKSKKVWIIVGCVIGGMFLLAVLGFLGWWVRKYKQRRKMQVMERASSEGEALQMSLIGNMKAPMAMATRTQPSLEPEYVP